MNARPRPLSLTQVWLFALVAFPTQALYMAIAVYLPQHYATTLGLELSAIGLAFAAVRLVDLPVDPLLGVAIDRTRVGRNRFALWLLAGTPVTMLAVYMLFMAETGVTIPEVMFWLLIMYLGTSMMTLAHSAWAANISPTYNERSRIFAAIGALGVAGMTLLFATPLLVSDGGENQMAIPAMGWFILLTLPLATLLATRWTPNPTTRTASASVDSLRNFLPLLFHRHMGRIFLAMLLFTIGTAWEGSLFLFYFTAGRGFSIAEASTLLIFALGMGLLGAPAAARLADRTSKHAAVMIIAVCYAVALGSLALVPAENKLFSSTPVMVTGFLYAGFHVLLRSMTADVIDEIRLAESKDASALLYALLTLAPKLAAALSIALTFSILAFVGFQPAAGDANTHAVLGRLEAAYLTGPIAFVLAGAICIFGYRLGPNEVADIREKLELRDKLS